MREQSQACAAYFKRNPGFHRILTELLKKYRRYGRPAGTVCLSDASGEECAAARSVFGRPFSPPLRFRSAEFEAALQQTRFQGASLKEVLELYFDATIQTGREVRENRDSRFSAMLSRIREVIQSAPCRALLDALTQPGGRGYLLLRREAERDAGHTERCLLQACQGMEYLRRRAGASLRLAVLSAQATSDPHALDSGMLGGKLFLHLLALQAGVDFPASAERRDSLYYESGILCDSISSLVTQTGLILETAEGEHPAYRLFRERHEICTLSLASLSGLTGVRSRSGRAYLLENEMVFTQLCDRAALFHSPLICTSGQPSVAALRLLDLLAAEGTELFYSGDFDGKGLSIAAQLCGRYPHLLRPWHMAPEDYESCRSEVPLSDASLALLQGCAEPALTAAAVAVGQCGRVGYQELLLPQLEADLIEMP